MVPTALSHIMNLENNTGLLIKTKAKYRSTQPKLRHPEKSGCLLFIHENNKLHKLTVQIDAPIYGTMTIYCKNAFHDELTARSAMYARNYQRFMDYKAEIKTLDDLLTFSLTHILAGEEMDELARQAYTARAKELGHPLFQPDTIDPDLLLHAIGRL